MLAVGPRYLKFHSHSAIRNVQRYCVDIHGAYRDGVHKAYCYAPKNELQLQTKGTQAKFSWTQTKTNARKQSEPNEDDVGMQNAQKAESVDHTRLIGNAR